MTTIAAGLTWGEGLRWHDGSLWVSDTQGGGIWTDDGGEWHRLASAAQPNGLWFLPNGTLVGAVMRETRVGQWDGHTFQTYADLAGVAVGPLGDMVGDAQGGLYVDDVGFDMSKGETPVPGRLIYIGPDGQARVVLDDVSFPNGLALVDGGRTLVFAETFKQSLTACTVQQDGTLTDRRVFANLAELVGPEVLPDGICAASDGGVWVCTLAGHAVVLVGDDGVRRRVDVGDLFPIACALDEGAGRLYVTLADSKGLQLTEAMAQKSVTTTVGVFDLA
jgi:sugar lactone lactonase YvrE